MRSKLFGTLSHQLEQSAAVALAFAIVSVLPAFAQIRLLNSSAAYAVSSASTQTPRGVKIVASVPLAGLPVTRMYTQQEYGRTYLYIEHGQQPLTAVDVTKKRRPQVVSREPGTLDPLSGKHVHAGLDNVGGRGELSVLDSRAPDDVTLLRAFGPGSSNLADRDSNLIYFASPSQLLIVWDDRWIPERYSTYY